MLLHSIKLHFRTSNCRLFANQAITLPPLQLFQRAVTFQNRVAIRSDGLTFTYADLLRHSASVRNVLQHSQSSIEGQRVAFLFEPSFDYAAAQWAAWSAGAIAVPLHPHHPVPELDYIVSDARASFVLCSPSSRALLEPIAARANAKLIIVEHFRPSSPNDQLSIAPTPSAALNADSRAMLIYTSGTTGKPKGVVWRHGMIEAQLKSMAQAWGWTQNDHILNVLVLSCALWSGAKHTFMPKFNPRHVWEAFACDGALPAFSRPEDRLNVFMAVPTVYAKLLSEYDKSSKADQKRFPDSCAHFRLMVSGSAALPESIMKRWQAVSGHVLLERYGMTETGMVLSNPLVRIVPSDAKEKDHNMGELRVRGPSVFREYWGKPEATADTFDEQGWFKTGDIAAVDSNGDYKIVGRASVDVIKSSGYKISALDIEREILEHPDVDECAVLGLASEEFGQTIAAIVAMKPGHPKLELHALKEFCKSRMAHYKAPQRLLVVEHIPRNAMGKVNKKQLVKLFE